MTENYRADRIDRLLNELKYELTRGIMDNEIEEQWTLRFIVPMSRHFKNGIVLCEFRSRPAPAYEAIFDPDAGPNLKIVRSAAQGGEK